MQLALMVTGHAPGAILEQEFSRLNRRAIPKRVALVDEGRCEVVLARKAAFPTIRAGARLRVRADANLECDCLGRDSG